MDGKKLAVFCVFGVLGGAFLGYCIYFDRKRRNDPDYKRKVLKRRRSTMRQNSNVIDLSDPEARDQFLAGQFELANQKMMEGNMEASISHFINFIQFSSNPKVALATLQQILPPALFKAIIQTFAAIAKAKDNAGPKEDVD